MSMQDHEVLETYLAECAARARQAFQTLAAIAACSGQARLTPVDTGSGIPLMVHRADYGVVAVDEVLNGTAIPVSILATEDGRGAYLNEWHEGASTDSVYVELWTAEGRPFHGWVDRTTRRLVQTG